MTFPKLQRSLISALAIGAAVFGLAVMWYVPTQPCLPISCLLVNPSDITQRGLEIRETSQLSRIPAETKIWGEVPEVGDFVVAVNGQPVRSFSDWARIHHELRTVQVPAEAVLAPGRDPSEQSRDSRIAIVDQETGQSRAKQRLVKVLFLRPGKEKVQETWLPLLATPSFSVSLTLLWMVLQFGVLAIGGVAYWNRPTDQPVRTFFALCALTMVAFVGGSHWWIIAGNPWLISIFAICGAILPATLLHFFLIHPIPAVFYAQSPGRCRWALYGPSAVLAAGLSTMIFASWMLAADRGSGPFAEAVERLAGIVAVDLMLWLRQLIYFTFAVALVYFLLSLLAIQRGLRAARNPLERQQVRSIQWAARFAIIPISITVYLALFHDAEFALGSARIPMFLASLAFLLAYGVGIAKYKLLLIDQVVSRGVWYYFASAALAVFCAALIAAGALQAMQQDLHLFGKSIPLVFVLLTSVLVLLWGRDAVQRILDLRFFREKYQLDRALQRMNRVVANVLEPEAVSDSLLNSCREVLHVEQAALYLRRENRLEFKMATAAGLSSFPLQIVLEPEALEALAENMVLQRAPHVHSPAQDLLRRLHADVVHGLDSQGTIGGLLVLGVRPNDLPYSAEDLAFISALARTTGVALQCATVQRDVVRLNQDLQLKIDKIADQERQLTALHHELAASGQPTVGPTASVGEEFQRAAIKGHGPAMTSVLETARKVAASNSSVLLRGESGTGKELLARAIHENSPRSRGPLVSVHCGALSPTLLESELFGHVKGAFTDARQDRVGRFQLADGGTLFLDEIGDISLDVQIKLLRVLQERTFEPVGGTRAISVDVRIIAATHRNLEQLIQEGKFREDLFYRLNVISITLPPLRERREDLYELALHFLRTACERSGKGVLKLDDDAVRAIQTYHWPGNIRELQNVMERAVVLTEGDAIRLSDLAANLQGPPRALPVAGGSGGSPSAGTRATTIPASVPSRQVVLRRTTPPGSNPERALLLAALAQNGNNKAEAARSLGLPRSTFFSKLKKHGIS